MARISIHLLTGAIRYDMDFNGPLYPLTTFVRSVSNKEQ